MDSFGFIIIRCVTSEEVNKYWNESYRCIREIYGNDIKIVIVDDTPIEKENLLLEEQELINCIIIKNEFPKSGEFAGYYYFYKYNYFSIAYIIHDSLFIRKKLLKLEDNEDFRFLMHSDHVWDNAKGEINLIIKLKNFMDIYNLYLRKNDWNMCFGVMSVIRYDYLKILQEKYDIFNLLNYIKTREDRMCMERVYACIVAKDIVSTVSYFGDINKKLTQCTSWGYTFNEYLTSGKENKNYHVVKVWTGR